MAKLAQQGKTLSAMTLVEVLVALAVVSFVFSSLTQMTFDALKKAKELELQDKMRNYATEASQIIYNEKDTNWKKFSETSLPPAESSVDRSQAHILYVTDPVTNERTSSLKPISQTQCVFRDNMLVGQGCIETAPPEGDNRVIFGRIIIRNDLSSRNTNEADPNYGESKNTDSNAELQIIVACIEGRCDPKEYKPFILNLNIFRTGGVQ